MWKLHGIFSLDLLRHPGCNPGANTCGKFHVILVFPTKKNQFWDDDCMLSRGLSADPRHIRSFQKKRFIGGLGPGGLDIWDSFMKGIVAFKTISTFSDARTFCCSICTSCGGVMDPTFVSIFSASKHRRLHRQFTGLALLCMLLHTWQLELVLRHSFALAEHLGVPSIVLTPWKAFLQGCTRAFKEQLGHMWDAGGWCP